MAAAHTESIGLPRVAPWSSRLRARLGKMLAALKPAEKLIPSLPTAPGDYILSTCGDSRGCVVAATDRGLYYPADRRPRAPVPMEWSRRGWEEIARVSWDDGAGTLTLSGLLPGVPPQTTLCLPEPSSIGLLARERVASTALVQTRLDLGPFGTARVLGPRAPGTNDPIWVVALDGDVPDQSGADAALNAALVALRVQLGI
jgi:hypothetical protein